MYVTLNDDDDVLNMIHLHMCMKLTLIELLAEKKEQIGGGKYVERVEEDDRHSSSDNEFEDAPAQNSIDAWFHCIRDEGQIFKDAAEYNLFGIRKCNLQHSCGEDNLRSRGHPRADAAWVANVLKDKLRGEPSYRPCSMMRDLHRDYGVEIGYRKVWKGKEIAMHDIHGSEKGCYDRLRWYCQAVRETNPGSVAEFGFATGCRPLIFLDGTHIKNKYKGSMLLVVTKDANDDLFTLAYSVVDAENDSNWEWFCYHLRCVILTHHTMGFDRFTFFSDRHPGIIKAIQLLFPGSRHAYCLRHLVDNFVKTVLRSYPLHNKKHWSSVFKKAAYAPSQHEFSQHINNIFESMPLAIAFIQKSKPKSWANALFRGNHWGVINNNIAECWNNWVKPARYLSVVSMVDHIRVQIMNMMHRRREATLGMVKELSPAKEKAVLSTYIESRTLRVHRSCGWKFEVVDCDKTCAVDLNELTCSCRQIHMLPCKHACAAIESKSMSVYAFCDKFFKTDMYRQTYKGIINPIPTFDMYEFNGDEGYVINAPDVRSQPGRRKTQRIPSQIQSSLSKCSRRRVRGHNRRSCKEAIN
ncbi:uncharacterized protein [Primulina huaijiensis]|uniref:uncharacterized protein n=1 Tax=Primulina huaijiensis TaxID=1492673 RepID=UPI003CC74418